MSTDVTPHRIETLAAPGGGPATGAAAALIRAFRRPPFNRGELRVGLAHMILGLQGRSIDTEFRGATFRIRRERNPIEYGMLMAPDRYNAEEMDFLAAGLTPGDICVDLGANIGMYALTMAAAVAPAGKVLAIEAGAEFATRLRENAELSGLSNVILENVAVGDRAGTVTLNAVAGNPGTATVSETEGEGIPMMPLLDILARHGIDRIAAMKVDIDGFEQKALGPFFDQAPDALLPRRMVLETIFIEDRTTGFVQAMKKRGYRITGQTRSNGLFERQG